MLAELPTWRSIWARTCSGVLNSSQRVSILFSTTSRPASVPSVGVRCSRQIRKSDWVTPVSAPRMNTIACAWGNKLTVSSGSAPMAFNPGVSSMTRPCFRIGCAMLISACLQRGTSTRPSSPIRLLSAPPSFSQKPSALACSGLTRSTSATRAIEAARLGASVTSSSMVSQASGRSRQSVSARGCNRVSMGNSRNVGGCSASYPSSVGHMVVRPALAGMIRCP